MTDSRQAYDEQLPWLEAVDDEDEPRGLSARKMFAALLVVLLAVAIVAATFFLIGRRDAALNGPPELIKAPPGPYKVKSNDPGALDIAGESETAFETSAGEDTDSQLATNTAGPVAVAPVKEEPKPLAAPLPSVSKDTASEAPATAAPAGGSGSVIQLGAFKNAAQAERAWTSLSTRFSSIAAMDKMVVPFPGGIRLRAGAATPAAARAACQALKAAGENCFVAH